jgi:hypothetical protein
MYRGNIKDMKKYKPGRGNLNKNKNKKKSPGLKWALAFSEFKIVEYTVVTDSTT